MAYPNPSIDGTVLELATFDGPMEVFEDNRSTYIRGRTRVRRKGALVLWLGWRWTFRGTAGEWAIARNLLEGDETGEFDFSPRGVGSFRCYCTSELTNLTPLRDKLATGELVYTVPVRVEAVAPVSERPPVYATGNLLIDVDGNALTDSDGNALIAPL
ncbi:MAG: hypothetical protein AAF170_07890 [Bacteroidota bacterium]